MATKYTFKNLCKWYNENKKEILQKASCQNEHTVSIYDQARRHFYFDGDTLRQLQDDIFAITWDNL